MWLCVGTVVRKREERRVRSSAAAEVYKRKALAYEMLLSPKEHEEFAIVREEVRRALATVAKDGENGVNAELEKGTFPCWGFPKSHPASRFADWGARSYVTHAVLQD